MKKLLFVLFLFGLTTPLLSAKPNIIIIMTDDMGCGDITCYNPDSKIITPNIDRLAKEGMLFSAAHSPDAVCTPTRYSILTGRYCWRTHLKNWVINGYEPSLIEHNRMTLASMLKENGYATGFVGKWHIGMDWVKKTASKAQAPRQARNPSKAQINIDFSKPCVWGPKEHGFAFSFHTPSGADGPPAFFMRDGIIENNDLVWNQSPDLACHSSRGYVIDSVCPRMIVEAKKWLISRKATQADSPFFLHFTPPNPHLPWTPTQEFKDKIRAAVGKDWDYGAFMLQMDDMVGQILHMVDSLGMTNNTLVILTSDNGPDIPTCAFLAEYGHDSNAEFRGMKFDVWEGGNREPFIARWPGKIPEGSVSGETICLTDMLATFAAIVGYKLPSNAGEDSYSILPALLGKKLEVPLKEATVVHSARNGYAILKGKWKYIDAKGSMGWDYPSTTFRGTKLPSCATEFSGNAVKKSDPAGQLYDLSEDRQETTNLYGKHPDTVKALKALLTKYKKEGRSAPAERSDAFFDDLVGVTHGIRTGSFMSAPRITASGMTITVRGCERYSLKLLDLRGSLVADIRDVRVSPVDLSSVRSGTYVVAIDSEQGSVTQSVVLTRR